MSELIIAKRYAKALTRAISDQGELDNVGKELRGIADLFESSSDLKELFSNPAFNPEAKSKILEKILKKAKLSKIVNNFLTLLLSKKRITHLRAIVTVFDELSDQIQGRIRMKVVTAVKLDDKQQQAIQTKFQKITGKAVFVEPEQDSSLIGGTLLKLGDTVFDGTIKNQLKNVKILLDREAVA